MTPDSTHSPAMSRLDPWLRRESWLRGFVYALFIFSTFTMAGMELAVVMLHLLVLYHRIRTPVSDWLPLWVTAPFLLFAALAVFSALIGPYPVSSLAEFKGVYRFFLPFVLLPALALVDTPRLMLAMLPMLVVVAVFSQLQYHFGWHPIHPWMIGKFATGGFGMYLTLGGVMLMSTVVYASLMVSVSGRERWLWGAASLLCLTTTILTTSRSAWLGVVVGLVVLLLRLPRRIGVPLATLGMLAIVGTAVLMGTGWVRDTLGNRFESPLLNRIINTVPASEAERVFLWRAALRGIADAPVFGHGLAPEVYNGYRDALMQEEGVESFTVPNPRPHNQYLRIALSMGLVGLAVFFWIWGVVFVWNGIWIYRAAGLFPFEAGLLWGINGALAGSLVSGFFLGQIFDAEVQINILMWIGLGLHLGLRLRRPEREGVLVAI